MSATRTVSCSHRSAPFSDALLREAVASMMMSTVTPAAVHHPPPLVPTRGQQLIAALHSISSLDELVCYEEDLRATLASREVSGRGRLERLQADEECVLEQSYALLQVEQRARSVLVRDYTATHAIPLALVSVAAAEEHARLAACLDYRAEVRALRRLAAPLHLQLMESSERFAVESTESLMRQEVTQRRYMEIGECAQFTQHCASKQCLQQDAWRYSTAFLSSARRLFAAEAADRESLELMFLFHRATLVTQEKEGRAASLQASVDWINSHGTR